MKRNFIVALLLACFCIFPLFCDAPPGAPLQIENNQQEKKAETSLDAHEKYWEEQESKEDSLSKKSPDIRSLFLKTVLLLVSVVGILLGASYFVKKMTGAKLTGMSSDGTIKLIERKYLSPKCSLWIVEVEGKKMIVVEGQNGVAVQALPKSE
jgi:flagellar biogenesis protein FliO